MNGVDVVRKAQQPLSDLSAAEAFFDFLPGGIGMREHADTLHAALPMTSQDRELCDDQRCFAAPGTRSHVHGIHGFQEIATGLIQSL
jgi:hypothetical protein